MYRLPFDFSLKHHDVQRSTELGKRRVDFTASIKLLSSYGSTRLSSWWRLHVVARSFSLLQQPSRSGSERIWLREDRDIKPHPVVSPTTVTRTVIALQACLHNIAQVRDRSVKPAPSAHPLTIHGSAFVLCKYAPHSGRFCECSCKIPSSPHTNSTLFPFDSAPAPLTLGCKKILSLLTSM